jgi:hypothetical protein
VVIDQMISEMERDVMDTRTHATKSGFQETFDRRPDLR